MDDLSSSIDSAESMNSERLSDEWQRAVSQFPDLPWGADDPELLDGAEDALGALRPESAGIADLIALPERASILLWNWDGIALGRYLRDSGHRVRFHDSRMGRQKVVLLLCGVESIRPLTDLDAENEAPDIVFVGHANDDAEESFGTLKNILKNTLGKGGIVVLAQPTSLPHPVY